MIALLTVGSAGSVGGGCASIPQGQYGVTRIEWIGTKAVDPAAIESCMVTRVRSRVRVMLGVSSPSCGKPPFDSSPPTIDLWTLPWTEWPVFDPAIFDVERERIERWYHARGYYDAEVVGVRTYVGKKEVDPNECHASGSDCELKVVVQMREGAPTYVENVKVETTTPLPAAVMEKLHQDLRMKRGQRLDEADYDADKETLEKVLLAEAYARAKVTGHVTVDRNRRTANVAYTIDPGPTCVFGKVTIDGLHAAQSDVPMKLLIQTANIHEGDKYDDGLVDDARRALLGLNVFSSVRIERRGQGRVVDLVATVQRGKITQLSAGVGVMSGSLQKVTSTETVPVPQWDVHLSGVYENRSFLGGLRRLRLEERPRLIFLDQFPGVENQYTHKGSGPQPGNIVSLRFEQPATFERRTKLVAAAAWDFGPDPYMSYFRHDITVKVGLERPFWRQRVRVRAAVAHDLYDVTDSAIPEGVSSYRLPYLEQQLEVDLRDNSLRPRHGVYFSFLIQEANKLNDYGSWNYVRVVPDLRAYVPLPLSIVLAARFALGALMVGSTADNLDPKSKRLGPQPYRMRGGGPNSNRGFAAGRLGDSRDGGTRRFEGSLELRVPLGDEFGFVLFGDVGDVSDMGAQTYADGVTPKKPAFRFAHLNTAVGFGLRYFSVLGAIRLDAGWRIPSLQTLDNDEPRIQAKVLPNAVHLTIGEAF
ncbi:MAG: hypothetical protein RL701_2275 [Pseudomonadota bacterium]